MKQFNCGDVVPGCGWVGRQEDEPALLADIGTHAHEVHGMDEVPPEVMDMIRAVIREA